MGVGLGVGVDVGVGVGDGVDVAEGVGASEGVGVGVSSLPLRSPQAVNKSTKHNSSPIAFFFKLILIVLTLFPFKDQELYK